MAATGTDLASVCSDIEWALEECVKDRRITPQRADDVLLLLREKFGLSPEKVQKLDRLVAKRVQS